MANIGAPAQPAPPPSAPAPAAGASARDAVLELKARIGRSVLGQDHLVESMHLRRGTAAAMGATPPLAATLNPTAPRSGPCTAPSHRPVSDRHEQGSANARQGLMNLSKPRSLLGRAGSENSSSFVFFTGE
jgi:hypothetical protein